MITAAIKSFCDMVKQGFSLWQTDINEKPTLELVRERKKLKKATDYTEEIITIVDKYTEHFEKRDLRKYNSLKKKFNKNN